jgi:hypothetical protein
MSPSGRNGRLRRALYVKMTVQELRANALALLRLALKAGENGKIAAAERLPAKATQYFDDADVIEAGDRRLIAQESK